MKKFLKLSIFYFFISSTSYAVVPEDGWWSNPNQSGRGWNLEIQNNILGIASFLYNPDGSATWFLSAGVYNPITNTFSATLDAFSGGQCQSCPFMPPVAQLNAGGPITIVFSNPFTGMLTWNGETIPIQRTLWAFPFTSTPPLGGINALLGGWSLNSEIIPGINDGEFLAFTEIIQSDDGTRFASGQRISDNSDIAVGAIFPDIGGFGVLLQSSSGFQKFWVFSGSLNNMAGSFWILKTGETPTGNGSISFIRRISGLAFLQQLGLMSNSTVANAGQSLTNDAIKNGQLGIFNETIHLLQNQRLQGISKPDVLKMGEESVPINGIGNIYQALSSIIAQNTELDNLK